MRRRVLSSTSKCVRGGAFTLFQANFRKKINLHFKTVKSRKPIQNPLCCDCAFKSSEAESSIDLAFSATVADLVILACASLFMYF